MIVLVDTNILLDVLQKRQPFHISADQLWKAVENRVIEAYVSAISFNNIFYLSRKQPNREAPLRAVQTVRRLFQIVPLDSQLIDDAIASITNDFEDAIQASAARRIKADHVITRNLKDFKNLTVAALTAEEFVALHLQELGET